MGQPFTGISWGGLARVGALAVGCLALAHCSGANKEYSPRVVEEGEPVPKGGGAYRVGKPYNVNGRIYVPAENPSYRAEGMASWYGRDFHGRLTANGEVYDMHSISAAHTTLPLPSYVRVTNLDNGRSMIVRVNDRGPYSRNRVIDLSIGTAKALDFYSRGVAHVRVEYVGRAPMEGSDDAMLIATLREGSPAPAPSKVMVAAAKPFIPNGKDVADSAAVAGGASVCAQQRIDPRRQAGRHERGHLAESSEGEVDRTAGLRFRRGAASATGPAEQSSRGRFCAPARGGRRARIDERSRTLLISAVHPLPTGRA